MSYIRIAYSPNVKIGDAFEYFSKCGAVKEIHFENVVTRTMRVVFEDRLSIIKVYQEENHIINNSKLIFYDSPHVNQQQISFLMKADADLLTEIDIHLNDDCILSILKYLDLINIIKFAGFNDRFKRLAWQQTHHMKLGRNPKVFWLGSAVDYVLGVLGFGGTLLELTLDLSFDSFPTLSSSYTTFIDNLKTVLEYVGPQLKVLNLISSIKHPFNQIKEDLKTVIAAEIKLQYEIYDFRGNYYVEA